jgi:hypothetical protein
MTLRKDYLKKTPIVATFDYTTKVPFTKVLSVTEHILNSADTLDPVLPGDGTYPLTGARTIYRLIGDGASDPIFGIRFKKTSISADYDNGLGVVNLIEFLYDGADYWYTIVSGAAAAGAPSIVGDYYFWHWGLTPATADLTCTTVSSVNVGLVDYGGAPGSGMAAVTAADVLTSVQYTGTDPITYTMEPSPEGSIPPISNVDPRAVGVAFDENALGSQTVLIKVSAGALSTNYMEVTVVVKNTL